jgi:hypothetical protein
MYPEHSFFSLKIDPHDNNTCVELVPGSNGTGSLALAPLYNIEEQLTDSDVDIDDDMRQMQ